MKNATLTVGQLKIAAAQRPEADAYWRNALRGATATSFRPDAPGVSRSPGGRLAVTVRAGVELARRLESGSRGDPRAMTVALAAGLAATLRAYTGDDDILIGTPAERAGSIARFHPLRVSLDGADTFRSLVRRVQDAASASHPHREFPVELVGPAPVVMVAVAGLHPDDAFAALDVDVGFVFARDDQGLYLRVHADGGRYTPDSALGIGQHYLRLLDQAMASPAVALRELDLVLDGDRALVRAVNDTARDCPDTTLTALFARTFAAAADRTAVLAPSARYTFAELDAASTRIARALVQAGVAANDVVAICAERSIEMLAAMVGVLRAGAAYLPIDPALPPARSRYLLDDSRAPVVLVQRHLAHLVSGAARVVELAVDTSPVGPGVALPEVSPRDAAYVIYTSGSTGNPKGVVVEHRSAVNRLHWMQRAYPLTPGDVILQKTPASFDVSVWELFWWLIEGASVSLLEPGGEREPASVVAAIERHEVTTMHFVPTMLGAFLEYVALTGAASRLSSLRTVFASGEALGVHHVRSFAEHIPGPALVNLYGPTEATVDVSHHVTAPGQHVVPIGKPIDNIRLHVLDAGMRPRPVGMVGELYIAGIGLARGYLNRPELTAERFVSGAPVGEDRLYRTGDLARWLPDGSIEYLGRNDFQVKLRGFRIELGEIEHRLRSHPAVEDAVVIVRSSDDQQQHLLGYIIAPEPPAERELVAYVAEALPGYMVPERIVRLDAFPLSPSGKLDQRALPEPSKLRGTYVPPRTEAEHQLAEIWAEVLGLDRVGVTESFFSLGGNSIHFVSVLAKARKRGLGFTFQQLFQHPTIEQLLAHAGDTAAGDIAPRTFAPFELLSAEDRARIPPGIEDAYPMSMLQSGLVYQSEIMHGNTSYHDIVSYLIQGAIDVEVFRKAVGILVERSPVFRTSYHLKEFTEYLQLVHAEVRELPLVVHDVRHLKTDAEHEAWYAGWFHDEQNRPFRWEQPGLVRLHIHILRDDLYRYSISQHNSALDGWSMNQVHTQLFDMYYTMLRGEPVAFAAVDNHLRNFIGLEQYAIHSEAHARFWRETLADRPTTAVPRLRPADTGKPLEVVFQDIALPAGLSDGIVALARELGVPVKNVLLAAHVKVLAVVCGDDDVLTGYEHAGRPELADADRALGVFLNTMPLRMKIADGSWEDLIRQTYRTEAASLPYRRYPMAKVKQDQRTTGDLFETVFNFTHFYSLKALKKLPEFALLDVRAAAITEFPLRIEFSRHFYTDEVQLSLHYHAGVFDPDHIARIGGYIARALELMVGERHAPHTARSLIGDEERARLAELGRGHGDEPAVVDRSGQLVPLGTPGYVVAGLDRAPEAGKGRRARWRPDGTLELELEAGLAPAPAPGPAVPEPAVAVAPVAAGDGPGEVTTTMQRIARVWSDVLKIPAAQIGADDDFFELGGNSLAALKVSLLLEGTVSLRNVMRYSRLHELAAAADRPATPTAGPERGLVVGLAGDVERAQVRVVCFPYAGGSAVHFKPFADAVVRLAPDVAVLGVELPGHDPQAPGAALASFGAATAAVADELARAGRGPYVLWGHCIGSAMALEAARLLGARGIPVRHLFLAAKLFYPEHEIRQTLRNADQVTFADIRELYAAWTGADSLASLGDAYQDFIARVFRHDSLEANRYLLARREDRTTALLDVPCTFVASDDDPATEGYRTAYVDWRRLVADVQLHEIEGGGHYFMRTRPEAVAQLIARTAGGEEVVR